VAARIRVPNSSGYKIVTTKTDNLKEAERFALDAYEDLYLHVKAGGSIKSKTFAQVFEEWEPAVTTMGPTRQGGSWEATIERIRSYALEFFGPKKIDTIRQTDFAEFWIWRKGNFSRRPPSNATLRRERTSLLPVFKFAVSKGYIAEVPETNAPKAATERRPTFTLDEWRVIVRKARQWVAEGKQKAVFRDRLVSQQCFLILANTGMRIGELRTLRWGDLRTVNTECQRRRVIAAVGRRESAAGMQAKRPPISGAFLLVAVFSRRRRLVVAGPRRQARPLPGVTGACFERADNCPHSSQGYARDA
jgi:integrase